MLYKTALDKTLFELAQPVAQELGYDIVRVRLMGERRPALQVMAERTHDKQMNLSDCECLSRALSSVLDVADILTQSYRLEVSSPGLDRPLTRYADFMTYAGYDARLELDQPVNGRKRFQGRLSGVSGDHICLDVEGQAQSVEIVFARIKEARLVLSEGRIKADES